MGVFDSLNETLGCTDCNAKNFNFLQCTVAEKIKKNLFKMVFLEKLPFWGVFLDFFCNDTLQRVEVFALQSVRPGASFYKKMYKKKNNNFLF